MLDSSTKNQLAIDACRVRMGIIEGVYHAHSGHPGGSLSIAELLTYLYHRVLRVNPHDPHNPDRDRLVLSKGHCAPGLYAILAQMGYFPESELQTLRHTGAMLQGHPDMKHTPGVDMSTGSLGQGISAAAGMALAAKLDGKGYRVYAILGDGELEEGQVWEAAMFAAAKQLDHLTAFVDNNNLQIDGTIAEVNSPYPIDEKFAAFGWHVITIDGQSFDQIADAVAEAQSVTGKPTAVIMKTVKGKGVSYMENQVGWHGSAPNEAQYRQAMDELTAELHRLQAAE